MTAYRADRDRFGPHDIAVLEDAARGRRVRIARRGACVLGIEATHEGRRVELADGYRAAAELEARPGSRFALLAPFANRVSDARYAFDGVEYDLAPGIVGARRAARHGAVRDVEFALLGSGADAAGAWAVFATQAIRPGFLAGYPFAIDLAVRYTLDARGLAVEALMRNVGTRAAPCFFGWHPYFRLGSASTGSGPMESWELAIPAATLVRTDADYLPLPGDAARQPMDAAGALDFRRQRAIGDVALNHAYADLAADADGLARTRLRDPASGLAVAVWQERGVLLAYTGDDLQRDPRGAIALEPMESWSDAFNRPDCADAIRLEAGAERRFRCGVEIETR